MRVIQAVMVAGMFVAVMAVPAHASAMPASPVQDSVSLRRAVDAWIATQRDAYRRGDAEAFQPCPDTNAIVLRDIGGGTAHRCIDVQSHMRARLGGELTIRVDSLRALGDSGVVYNTMTFHRQVPGATAAMERREIVAVHRDRWRREGGRWRQVDMTEIAPQRLTSTRLADSTAGLGETFRRLLQARADILATRDTSLLRQMHDPAMTMIDEKGARGGRDSLYLRFTPLPEALAYRERIDDTRVDTAGLGGRAAIVTYRTTMHLTLNGEPVTKVLRVTEVFRRAPQPSAQQMRVSGGWQSVAYQETVVPGIPVATGADTAQFKDFIGRYQLFPGVVYRVRRDSSGARLLWGNRVLRELVPENANTFVIGGDQYRVVFVRDASGRVTHLRMKEFPGVEYNAMKLDN